MSMLSEPLYGTEVHCI